jgi:hypothetical protein
MQFMQNMMRQITSFLQKLVRVLTDSVPFHYRVDDGSQLTVFAQHRRRN